MAGTVHQMMIVLPLLYAIQQTENNVCCRVLMTLIVRHLRFVRNRFALVVLATMVDRLEISHAIRRRRSCAMAKMTIAMGKLMRGSIALLRGSVVI
jgi:hypothetical protein